jgi:hypothetical protein
MTEERMRQIGEFLHRTQQRVQESIAREMQNTPDTEKLLLELKTLGIQVFVEYGCTVRCFVSEEFEVPGERVFTPDFKLDDLFTAEDREFFRQMNRGLEEPQ